MSAYQNLLVQSGGLLENCIGIQNMMGTPTGVSDGVDPASAVEGGANAAEGPTGAGAYAESHTFSDTLWSRLLSKCVRQDVGTGNHEKSGTSSEYLNPFYRHYPGTFTPDEKSVVRGVALWNKFYMRHAAVATLHPAYSTQPSALSFSHPSATVTERTSKAPVAAGAMGQIDLMLHNASKSTGTASSMQVVAFFCTHFNTQL